MNLLINKILTNLSNFNISSSIGPLSQINYDAACHVVSNSTKLNASELVFKTGEELKIETNNKKIDVEEKDSKLLITEKKSSIFNKGNNSILVITLPNEYLFDLVNIESKII